MSVRPHRDTECTRKAKISQLEIVIFVDQKILRLEVSMEYTMRVAVQQARIQLMCEFLKGKRYQHPSVPRGVLFISGHA